MEGIEQCDFIALIVRDIRGAVRFYQDILGLPLRFVDGDHYALFQVGAMKLALQVARPAGPDLPVADDLIAPTAQCGASVLVAFAVTDVDRWCATLKERGVVISREPADYPWGDREFSVHDPDGHVLIFHGPSKGRA
ncbi:MAG TPA: VOC family protein [Candidatus Methylomirabilis sp.]|nr:VOC family protein [Candidatus Methylomirabilis sp.]